MLALSRTGNAMFLHQPDQGLAIPVMLDFDAQTLSIGFPSIECLEEDFTVFDDIESLKDSAGSKRANSIELARRLSSECSDKFSQEIAAGTLTIRALANKVSEQLQGAGSTPIEAGLPTFLLREVEEAIALTAD